MAETFGPVNQKGLLLVDFEHIIRINITAVGETKYIRRWKVDPRAFYWLAKHLDNKFNYLWTTYHKT